MRRRLLVATRLLLLLAMQLLVLGAMWSPCNDQGLVLRVFSEISVGMLLRGCGFAAQGSDVLRSVLMP